MKKFSSLLAALILSVSFLGGIESGPIVSLSVGEKIEATVYG